jgi:diguanylate cyclase (GGDEF)-like protein/PAS domain S-box-containing protein
MAELSGYTQDEMAGRELWEVGLFEGRDACHAVLLQVTTNGVVRDAETRWIPRQGDPREMEFDAALIREGEQTVIQCHVRDITERKRRERENRAENERLLAEALERAEEDPLTGLLNHRAFHRRLEEETIRASRDGSLLAVAILDLDNFKFFNDAYGHSAGDQVLRTVADRLRAICRPYDAVSRFGGDEFALLLGGLGAATSQEITAHLRARTGDLQFLPEEDPISVPVPITLTLGVALFPSDGWDRLEVMKLADARLLRAKARGKRSETSNISDISDISDSSDTSEPDTVSDLRAATLSKIEGFSVLDALVTAVDSRDRYTRRHSDEVLNNSLRIARELGLSEEETQTVARAALIHDVGNIGVSDAVLRKPGKLTDDEFQAVKRHAQMGAAIVAAFPALESTLDAVRHHHERWDGMGYPHGLAGEAIPLLARVLAVADAYSAITQDHPYRKGTPSEEAMRILEAGAETQWDPACVAALLRSYR